MMLVQIPSGSVLNPQKQEVIFDLGNVNDASSEVGNRFITYDSTRELFVIPTRIGITFPERMLFVENWAQSLSKE